MAALVTGLDGIAGDLEKLTAAARQLSGQGRAVPRAKVATERPAPAPAPAPAPEPRPRRPAAAPPAPPPSGDGLGTKLPRAERAILGVLAQFPTGRTKRQVAIMAGYAVKGGGFNNALSSLRSAGLIERGEPIVPSAQGLAVVAGQVEKVPTGADLVAYWAKSLPKAERLILEALVGAFPASMTKEELGEATGYASGGGGFNNALSKLRTLELVHGSGALRADEALAC